MAILTMNMFYNRLMAGVVESGMLVNNQECIATQGFKYGCIRLNYSELAEYTVHANLHTHWIPLKGVII